MKGLIIKDLLQLKSYLRSLIIFMFIFICVSLEPKNTNIDGILTIMMTLGLGMFGIATFSYDEMAKANKYILTFPITKKEIVLSKYILQFILTLTGAILGTLLSVIISLILNKEIPNFTDLVSIALGGMVGIGLVESIQMPCFYKFGAEKGRIYMFMITIAVAFICGGIFMLGEKIVNNFSINLSSINNILEVFFPLVLIGLIVFEYFISYKISYKIYSKKEF